jgi:hypothetical protein
MHPGRSENPGTTGGKLPASVEPKSLAAMTLAMAWKLSG